LTDEIDEIDEIDGEMEHFEKEDEDEDEDAVDEGELSKGRESGEVLRTWEETGHGEGSRLDAMMGDFLDGPF
jgi:hypothetical protein